MSMRLALMAIAFGSFLGVVIAVGRTQDRPSSPLSEVTGIVTDESGAVIPNSELAFKGKSDTIVSHTGVDGRVRMKLPSGTYVVTIARIGFTTTKLLDFQVTAPTPATLRAALKVAHTHGAGDDFVSPAVHTITSESPRVISPAPSHDPSPTTQLGKKKSRSLRCLNLWKCSPS